MVGTNGIVGMDVTEKGKYPRNHYKRDLVRAMESSGFNKMANALHLPTSFKVRIATLLRAAHGHIKMSGGAALMQRANARDPQPMMMC